MSRAAAVADSGEVVWNLRFGGCGSGQGSRERGQIEQHFKDPSCRSGRRISGFVLVLDHV